MRLTTGCKCHVELINELYVTILIAELNSEVNYFQSMMAICYLYLNVLAEEILRFSISVENFD